MSRSRKTSSLTTGLFVLILLAGGLYIANKGILSSQNKGGAPLDVTPEGIGTQAEPAKATDQTATDTLPDVLVLTKKGKATEVHLRPSSGDEKTVFTDADESTKLQQPLGTNFKDRLFAWMSADQSGATGAMTSITVDGTGKTSGLGEEISTTSTPALSPDGSQVAFIGFDNSEGSFGFSLMTKKLSGGEASQVDSSGDGIALPRWSPSGGLAYVVGQATPDKGQELRIHQGNNHGKRFASDKNQLISDFTWLGDDRWAVVVEPLGNNASNQAKVLIVQANDGKVLKTIDKPGKERSLQATKSGSILGFIAGEVSGVESTPGTVTIVDLESDKETTRGDAIGMSGFLQ